MLKQLINHPQGKYAIRSNYVICNNLDPVIKAYIFINKEKIE